MGLWKGIKVTPGFFFFPPLGCKTRLLGATGNLAPSPGRRMGFLGLGQPQRLLPLPLLLLSIVLGALPLLLPGLEAPAQPLLVLLLAQMPFFAAPWSDSCWLQTWGMEDGSLLVLISFLLFICSSPFWR